MIFRIINQSIIGIYDPFRSPVTSIAVNVALIIIPSFFFRKASFIISKIITADTLSGCNGCEVFSGGLDYAGDTGRYLRLMAEVNRKLAARAHRVCEVVCGIPQEHKGAWQEYVVF